MNFSSLKKKFILGGAALFLLTVAVFSPRLVETNNFGNYIVLQDILDGEMSVHTESGPFFQALGKVTEYSVSDMNYFSKLAHEGGSGVTADPIQVRFNDGGTAKVSGSLKFKLSLREEDQLRVHQDFKGYNAVQQDLIRQTLTGALMQTATLMKAEESYSTRRSEFELLARLQIERGIFETISQEVEVKDAEGNEFIEQSVNVKRNEDGNPVVLRPSLFLRYNVEVLAFVIKEIDFDETIDALIAKKKEAEQAKVVAKSNAERAKQDAITEYEQGQARIAKAKANEEVQKITAVTQAQKNKEVGELQASRDYEIAKFNRQRDEEVAQGDLAIKRAEAEAAKLLVRAGLTPMQRATIEKDTAIGVAEALAKIKLPSAFIAGGSGSGGGALDPFTAIGLNQMLDISSKVARDSKFTQ